MIGREGPGPERPGPDYPPEWDREPEEERRCTCLPYSAGGDGPEEDCPVHGRDPEEEERRCGLCGLIPAEGEQHRQVFGGGPDGDEVEEVCIGADRHQLDYATVVPDPWQMPTDRDDPPPF